LIMMTFRPCLNMNDLHVNHIYGDKLDNYLFNLEWTTRALNMQHENILNNDKAYTEVQVNAICKLREQGLQIHEIIKELGLEYSETERMRVRRIILGEIYNYITCNYDMPPLESEKYSQKIDEDIVIQICEMRTNMLTPKEICERLGWDYESTKGRVNHIINRETWIEISKDYIFPPYENLKYGQKFTEKIVRDICELRMQSKSCKEIMNELELDYNDRVVRDRVTHILRKSKWKNVVKDYNFPELNDKSKYFDNDIVKQICELHFIERKNTKEIMDILNLDFKNKNLNEAIREICRGNSFKKIVKGYKEKQLNTFNNTKQVE